MKEQGWIRLHRKIRENWIWQDPLRLKWWMDILLEANHEDHSVLIGNTLYMCKRGQTIKSLTTWSKRWGVDRSTVRRFLNLLQKDSMVFIETNTQTTQLTICAYDQYQVSRHTDETQMKHQWTSNETLMHINNNGYNENNEKNSTTDSNFDLWWKEYPKKVGKKAALKAWQKAKDKPQVSKMIEILEKQRNQEQWQRENGKYIPNPETYLNQGRWEDEIESHNLNKPKFVM